MRCQGRLALGQGIQQFGKFFRNFRLICCFDFIVKQGQRLVCTRALSHEPASVFLAFCRDKHRGEVALVLQIVDGVADKCRDFGEMHNLFIGFHRRDFLDDDLTAKCRCNSKRQRDDHCDTHTNSRVAHKPGFACPPVFRFGSQRVVGLGDFGLGCVFREVIG